MTRNEFARVCGILGVGLPFATPITSCASDSEIVVDFDGNVIIIGAGAGGLSSGYLLKQRGVSFEILEASSNFGGRMKTNTNFADFPIPLGAEWLETNTGIFREIVNDSSVEISIETFPDNPDRKFVNSSWFNFFEEYIVPSISDKIIYNTIVQSIDYSGEQIVINTQNGKHTADKVIISVPLKILQDGDISFQPDLPEDKLDAINSSTVWEGFKAFIEFSEKFYNDEYAFNVSPSTDGQKIYYNAALGQNSSRNVLGLFVVGKPALDFISLSGDQLRDFILDELDGLYSNQATPNYVKHITQNWNEEPFVRGGYLTDHADWRTVRKLGESVADKIYFAGGAYTDGEDWVSVHTAALAAQRAIEELTN